MSWAILLHLDDMLTRELLKSPEGKVVFVESLKDAASLEEYPGTLNPQRGAVWSRSASVNSATSAAFAADSKGLYPVLVPETSSAGFVSVGRPNSWSNSPLVSLTPGSSVSSIWCLYLAALGEVPNWGTLVEDVGAMLEDNTLVKPDVALVKVGSFISEGSSSFIWNENVLRPLQGGA